MTGNSSAVNTYGPDGPACRTSGGSTVFYSFDQQGNLSGRTDSSGNILTSSGYAAFGYSASFATSQSGSFTDPFGYNAQWGYYFDREHSYYLCGHRYYDHDGGRWLTRDPIGYAGGINLYSYCGQGPVGWRDPSGHKASWGASLAMGLARAFASAPPWLQNLLVRAGLAAPSLLSNAAKSPVIEEAAEPAVDEAEAATGEGMTTVGRWMWMCRGEYEKMVSSGRVQASESAAQFGKQATNVLVPPSPGAYANGATAGDGFVTFQTPTQNIVFGSGDNGWAKILGGGDPRVPILFPNGLPEGMPPATGIGPWIQNP